VIAEVARSLGILTVAVVTKPFSFEGSKRMKIAEQGIGELSPHVDSLIVILNDKLEEVLGEDVTQEEAFKAADDVLNSAVAGIAEIINQPGLVNVDFQDVRTVMSEQGMAMMGSAAASGIDRGRIAAEQAIACPLLEGVNLAGARGVLVNISASRTSLKLRETKEVMNTVRAFAAEDATIIYGGVYDDALGEDLRVTVVATGLGAPVTRATAQAAAGRVAEDGHRQSAARRRRRGRLQPARLRSGGDPAQSRLHGGGAAAERGRQVRHSCVPEEAG
jgi:cell division protein FtsZ